MNDLEGQCCAGGPGESEGILYACCGGCGVECGQVCSGEGQGSVTGNGVVGGSDGGSGAVLDGDKGVAVQGVFHALGCNCRTDFVEEVGSGRLSGCCLVSCCLWEGVGNASCALEDNVNCNRIVPSICCAVEVVEAVIPEDVREA